MTGSVQVRQAAASLEQLINDSAPCWQPDGLRDHIESLLRESSSSSISIDIILFAPLNALSVSALADALGFGITPISLARQLKDLPAFFDINSSAATLHLSVFHITAPPPRSSATLPPPVLLCDLTDVSNLHQHDLSTLDWFCKEVPIVFALLRESGLPSSIAPVFRNATRFEVLQPPITLEMCLSSAFLGAALELLTALSLAQGLNGLIRHAGSSLEHEIDNARIRISLLQSSLQRLQAGNRTSLAEVIGSIKGIIQPQLTSFERDCDDKIQALLMPPVGAIWSDIENWITSSIPRLDEEKGAESTTFRVSDASISSLTDILRSSLREYLDSALNTFQQLSASVDGAVTERLDGYQLPSSPESLGSVPPRRIDRLLNTTVTFQRPYESETPTQGYWEFTLGTRKFLLLFLMFSGFFGLRSVLMKKPELMIPISAVLIAAGALTTIQKLRRRRAELRRRELRRAHEALKQEIRRMCSDFQMKWLSLIKQHLADELLRVAAAYERRFRDQLQDLTQHSEEEKKVLQRDLQQWQNIEKSLLGVSKTKDTLANVARQAERELRQQISTITNALRTASS